MHMWYKAKPLHYQLLPNRLSNTNKDKPTSRTVWQSSMYLQCLCVCVCRKGAPSDAQGQFGITQCSTKAIWQAQGGGGTSEAAWDKAGQDRVERGRAGERRVWGNRKLPCLL